MRVRQVYDALESIDQGNASRLDRDSTQFLQDRGLVTVLSSSDYHSKQSDARSLGTVSGDVDNYQTHVHTYQGQKDALSRKLNSGWHRFWSWQTTLDREQRDLEDAEANLETATSKLSSSQSEKQRIEALKRDLEGYVETSGEYSSLTNEGSQRMNELSVRLYRLGEQDYGTAQSEIEQTNQAIGMGVSRFKAHYDEASPQFSSGRKLRGAMATLSKRNGSPDENVVVFKTIYELLSGRGHNWNSSDSYGVIAASATEDRAVEEIAELLDSTYVKLGQANIPTGRATRNLASRFIRGENAAGIDRKLARFHEVYGHFREEFGGSEVNRMVAASLMNVEGTPESVVGSFNELYGTMRDSFSGGEKLRLATAPLLLGKNAGMDTKARFEEAYEKLMEMGRSGSSYYPLVAGFALMPGSTDEVFEIFEKTQEKVREQGVSGKEGMFIASNLMGSVYQSWSESGLFDQMGLSSSSYDSSSYDSSSGFNVGWAVAGDLIDNGSLDLSGGFIAGGLIGGLFD